MSKASALQIKKHQRSRFPGFFFTGGAHIKTERLELRRLRPEDAAAVYQMTREPEVAAFMRFHTHRSLEEARALIREYTAQGNEAFLYMEKETHTPAGIFALKKVWEDTGAYDLSIFSLPAFWGKGYATELLSFFLPYAKTKLKAKTLQAYVVRQNLGSRRALEKNGFVIQEQRVFDDLPEGLCVYTLSL